MQISEEVLHKLVSTIITAAGSSAEETRVIADHLIRANLTGHDSHGAGMVPTYIKSIQAGLLKPNTPVKLVSASGSILVFDGQRGFGQRVAREAMDQGIERCRETGLVLMALRNAHHIGRVGSYGEQSLAAGLISLSFVNVTDHPPLVTAYNGAKARFLTNPICFAMPATEQHPAALLDMATSKIALGKARVALYSGKPVDEGCLLDAEGQPTTDPRVLLNEPRGALTPFGDYKGFGISFFCEMLAGALTGGGTIQPGNKAHGSIVNNMITFLVDPARLVDVDWMKREIDALTDYVLDSPTVNDAEGPVMIAGTPERLAMEQRQREGIPVDTNTWAELQETARTLGLDPEPFSEPSN
ncbi:MAG: malate/lactate/ureidoglycolate dehydrogenase [Deltaproteobacteria bacterium]|nr:MAG: malate/lactate/ureidoglycolate dehydrogenase [Deltaproteobacteria bacterium]